MELALIPILILILVAQFMPSWSRDAPFRTAVMVAGFSLIAVSYIWWRLTQTVLPARGISFATAFVWTVFLAELWIWIETMQLALILLRRTNRSTEADTYEAQLRALAGDELPGVDVFIATYNEPLDVLEKTIAGALALDWPKDRLFIHVLDDGRRDWLRDYCQARGVNFMARNENSHAKAGNINAAVKQTSAPFILILDADFVPQNKMLMRSIGFFRDTKVGIVQMPHHFFNSTPLQTNMDMRSSLPDQQRFFFDVIQPGRDAVDCAFCCGSNGIIRRSALAEIGGQIPTGSVTEDLLLTLVLLRKGYVTRYLGERLAIGLAPETLDAYFVQRGRWAQGGIQTIFMEDGPVGPGLTLVQRMMFLPSHWISQAICQPIAMTTPAIFLLTGAPPLINASVEEILAFQLPAIIAAMIFMHFLAPREFAPISAAVESMLQAFRLMPIVLFKLIKPTGHSFKVTPKGSEAGIAQPDSFTIIVALGIIFATGLGLLINSNFNTHIVTEASLLPVVAFWSVFNMIVLLIVATIAVPRPVSRTEERFDISEPCRIVTETGDATGETTNISMSGILVATDNFSGDPTIANGDWVGVKIAEVGIVPCIVRRAFDIAGRENLGMSFDLSGGPMRDRLIQKLFATGRETMSSKVQGTGTFLTMLARVFGKPPPISQQAAASDPGRPPEWLSKLAGMSTNGEFENTPEDAEQGFRRA